MTLKQHQVLQVGNIAGVAGTIVINILANALPINGKNTGQLSDNIPNLFVPIGLTFSVWGVIYLFLTFFAVYQAKGLGKGEVPSIVNHVGPWNIVACAGNIFWIFLWHYEQVALSLVAMLVLFAGLLMAYLKLKIGKEDTPVPWQEKFFGRAIFSIYLGWITVATIANVTAVLVVTGWDAWGIAESTWTVLVVIVAGLITALMLLTRKDWIYSLVVIWATLGIYLKQGALYADIGTTTILVIIAIAAVMALVVVKKVARK